MFACGNGVEFCRRWLSDLPGMDRKFRKVSLDLSFGRKLPFFALDRVRGRSPPASETLGSRCRERWTVLTWLELSSKLEFRKLRTSTRLPYRSRTPQRVSWQHWSRRQPEVPGAPTISARCSSIVWANAGRSGRQDDFDLRGAPGTFMCLYVPEGEGAVWYDRILALAGEPMFSWGPSGARHKEARCRSTE